MTYSKGEIITLDNFSEFEVIDTVNYNNNLYLYLKNTQIDRYTIVKAIENKLYNIIEEELSIVIANILKNRWVS